MEIQTFLDHLAADSPTPGGGSASALAGSLAASLAAMVAGLSSRKGRPDTGEMKAVRRKALVIQQKLYRAVEEDARSFEAVMAAFRLPKDSEKQRIYRTKMIQRAYQKATLAPQKVCDLSLQVLQFSKVLLSKGNQNAFSDSAVAAYLASAAFEGGLLNIKINLGSIVDRSFRKEKESSTRELAKKRGRLMKEIENEIRSSGY